MATAITAKTSATTRSSLFYGFEPPSSGAAATCRGSRSKGTPTGQDRCLWDLRALPQSTMMGGRKQFVRQIRVDGSLAWRASTSDDWNDGRFSAANNRSLDLTPEWLSVSEDCAALRALSRTTGDAGVLDSFTC
jgi:hypothetical protein